MKRRNIVEVNSVVQTTELQSTDTESTAIQQLHFSSDYDL